MYRTFLFLPILAALAALPNAAAAATLNVTNSTELANAIATAAAGDEIVLAPGSYAALSISNRTFSSPVTIRSQSSSNPARIAGMSISNSSNVTLRNLHLGRGLASGEREWTQINGLYNSQSITLDGVMLHGSLDGNPGNDGWCLFASRVSNVRVLNSEIQQCFRGFIMEQSNDVRVANNRFHNLRSDGLNFSATNRLTAENNFFTDFFPIASDHPDGIQGWNIGQPSGSSDIVLRNNVVLQGRGAGPQGIFLANGEQHRYRNVTIENNLVYSNDQFHGIMVSQADGLRIAYNTTISQTTDDKRQWIMLYDTTNVTIERNVTEQIQLELSPSVTQRDNVVLMTNPPQASQIPNRNRGSATTVSDLVISGFGHQPSGSLPAPMPTPPPPPPAPAPTPTPTPTPTPPPPIPVPPAVVTPPQPAPAPTPGGGGGGGGGGGSSRTTRPRTATASTTPTAPVVTPTRQTAEPKPIPVPANRIDPLAPVAGPACADTLYPAPARRSSRNRSSAQIVEAAALRGYLTCALPSFRARESMAPASALFTRPLGLGERSDDVRALQAMLMLTGHFAYPEATGFFGPATQAAVAAFQQAHGLEAVGSVGPMTRGVLNAYVAPAR